MLKIAAIGDVMIEGIRPDAAVGGIWAPVNSADMILANLECPVTTEQHPRMVKKYNFKASPESLALFDRRFVLSLANNHVMDYGARGLADTIGALHQEGLMFSGAGMNLDEARQPAEVEVNGCKVAVICAADPRYQAAGKNTPGTFPAEVGLLRETLQDCRRRSDLLIVSLHMGMEFIPYPGRSMQQLAQLSLEGGAAIVLFHHAHCVSGVSIDPDSVVIWGAGNYLFRPDDSSGFRLLFESAVWKICYNGETKKVQSTEVTPIVLDTRGWPSIPQETTESRIRKRIDKLSSSIRKSRILPVRCLLGVLSLAYLKVNIPNYMYILRQEGIRGFSLTILSSLKTHLTVSEDNVKIKR